MKPSAFDYVAPNSLDEALELYASASGIAKILAGGQSLVPLMNFRLAAPDVLVDLSHVEELKRIEFRRGRLSIGSMTTQARVERSPLVTMRAGLLGSAVRLVGHQQIRNRGTVGGSICHADPSSELPAAALAMDARMVAASRTGTRTIEARDFFKAPFVTALEPGEICTEIVVDELGTDCGFAVREFTRRVGDFALAGVACTVRVSGAGTCRDVRLVGFGIGPVPVRFEIAEESLRGMTFEHAVLTEVARNAAGSVEPSADPSASREFKRRMLESLIVEALSAAFESARRGSERNSD